MHHGFAKRSGGSRPSLRETAPACQTGGLCEKEGSPKPPAPRPAGRSGPKVRCPGGEGGTAKEPPAPRQGGHGFRGRKPAQPRSRILSDVIAAGVPNRGTRREDWVCLWRFRRAVFHTVPALLEPGTQHVATGQSRLRRRSRGTTGVGPDPLGQRLQATMLGCRQPRCQQEPRPNLHPALHRTQ